MEYQGIKRIGHLLKMVLPISVFSRVLAGYHKLVGLMAVPKAHIAMRRVDKAVSEFRRAKTKIRFGFYVVLDAMFQWRRVFELMSQDNRFDPFIVVVPRIGYQDGDMKETVEKTYRSLAHDFPHARIYKGYENGMYNNHLEDCDACTMMNLYRGLAVKEFETEHFAKRGVPIFASSYFYEEGTIHSPEYYGMSSLKYVYRFYCSHEAEKEKFIRYQNLSKDTQKVLSVGCAKTDKIKFCEHLRAAGKTVLLAPHHSILPNVDDGFTIGNFLKYKDFFLTLPRRYPQIHWIFRPHPHLRLRLTKDYTWKLSDWDDYVRAFTATPNAEYEDGGPYYDSFERSDAIVQDCSSFLAEYFYTGKPHCYMLANERVKFGQFDEWGRELLAHTYQAFTEEDVIKFIEDVVIGGNDTMRETRQKFAKEKVMMNYPHASEAVFEDIAETLGHGKSVEK